jgi:hypothetical protein
VENAVLVHHFYYDTMGDSPEVRRRFVEIDNELLSLIPILKMRKPGNTQKHVDEDIYA